MVSGQLLLIVALALTTLTVITLIAVAGSQTQYQFYNIVPTGVPSSVPSSVPISVPTGVPLSVPVSGPLSVPLSVPIGVTAKRERVPCVPPFCTYECDQRYIMSEADLLASNQDLLSSYPPPKVCGKWIFRPTIFGMFDSNVAPCMGYKSFVMSPVVAGQTSTYVYKNTIGDELQYMRQYRLSYYGYSKIKGGWDCNRHYEIISQYSMPWFDKLETSPVHTMAHLPKKLLLEARALLPYNVQTNRVEWNNDTHTLDEKRYSHLMHRLMHYARHRLTTRAIAQYMLEVTNNTACRTVLLIAHRSPDYMKDSALHGWTQLFGANLTVWQAPVWMYKAHDDTSAVLPSLKLYGQGVAYAQRLEMYTELFERDVKLSESDITKNIENRLYDIIVYGSITRQAAFLPLVLKHYSSDRIIAIDGEDIESGRTQFRREKASQMHYFLREINDDCERI